MLFNSQTYEDIHRYYRNTYVKFKETGDCLFFINQVSQNVVSGTDEDGTAFDLYLNNDDPYEVDYVLPNKSYFQYAKRACMLQRIPAKQYRRGLCSDNVRITALTKTGGSQTMDISFEVLKAFVAKQAYPSIRTVLTQRPKPLSIALSPRFAYVPDAGVLFCDQLSVAIIDKKENTLKIIRSIFTPEIEKLVKGSDLDIIYE